MDSAAIRAVRGREISMIFQEPMSSLNPAFTIGIEGLDAEESRDLLAEIYAHCQNPGFIEDFHWRDGSVAFWDNRATWHFARNDYPGYAREMHRITIEGGALD